MYNCQNSKEIELLKPSFGLFQVDEYCIVNLILVWEKGLCCPRAQI